MPAVGRAHFCMCDSHRPDIELWRHDWTCSRGVGKSLWGPVPMLFPLSCPKSMIPPRISGRTAVAHHKWTCSYADTVICYQCCKSFALRSPRVQSQILRGRNIFPRLWRKSPGSQRDLELGTSARCLYLTLGTLGLHLKSYTFVSLSMYGLGVGGVTPTLWETNVSLAPVLLSILTNEHCTSWTAKFGLLEYFSISFIWPST